MRDWNKDGRVLTPEDADQCIDCYQRNYMPSRFAWLMKQATEHGHPPEIAARFRAALAQLKEIA